MIVDNDPVREARERYLDLLVVSIGSNLVRFVAVQPFTVDGVEYDRDRASGTCRPMVIDIEEHECAAYPEWCHFDDWVDNENLRIDPYRWAPGMVYYRSTEFDTPIHGG